MKKYRSLIPILVIALVVGSWFILVKDTISVQSEYDQYLSEARKYAEVGITKYAIENYNLALSVKSTPDVYQEVAEYYKNQKKYGDYISWSEEFFEAYPTTAQAYDCLLDAYLIDKDYEACYDVLAVAGKRHISSDYIKKIQEDIKYEFSTDFNSYDNVSAYGNNYCAVQSKELWGFVDRYGNQRIPCQYLSVGAFTQSGRAPVINGKNEVYFIDKSGSKVMVSKEKYQAFGSLVENVLAAQKPNGKYVYLNDQFEELFGDYSYATPFNNGVAAVQTAGQWMLINADGKSINDTKYVDVIRDEKEFAFRNERAFVAVAEGKYVMIDTRGKQVGSLTFEDAKTFAGEGAAAVKINGQWQFVNTDGNLISDHKYEDARSFSNGLAAVLQSGKWGFVDESETVVIPCRYFDAKDFTEKGSCFVKTGEQWQLIKLYRLNREG